jgi:hypothetical protein
VSLFSVDLGAPRARAAHSRFAPLKRLSTKRLLIARNAQASKHSRRYVLVEGRLAYAKNATRRRSHCRDRFDFPDGSWPAIAKATLRLCDGGYAAPSRRDRFPVGRTSSQSATSNDVDFGLRVVASGTVLAEALLAIAIVLVR